MGSHKLFTHLIWQLTCRSKGVYQIVAIILMQDLWEVSFAITKQFREVGTMRGLTCGPVPRVCLARASDVQSKRVDSSRSLQEFQEQH